MERILRSRVKPGQGICILRRTWENRIIPLEEKFTPKRCLANPKVKDAIIQLPNPIPYNFAL
jgi:hypothetical protein